ncbi:hypothetical protein LWC34_34970 [Kibdelosporangium philippinense]|uniref:Excreted virulence factor EspC, type VII ESX diderm n=1 Tax=Kibdelosporangium philippinense TaxID=211113 RepID=A0ABS8ZKH1_9PSEU|nr:hypothetical protein [Kibdelosporangium philippinense]MCE7007987.1 hypothetical protein [Kibdelosporangium philippinense]
MPDGYRLELGGMGKLIDQLAHAEERMTKANDNLRHSSAKDMGSFLIDQAGNAFQDRWEYGIGKLAECTGKMVDGLDATRKQYQQADQATAEYFPGAQGDTQISRRMGGAT